MSAEKYYIQTTRIFSPCATFWRVGGKGYTTNLDEAWLVGAAKAASICRDRPTQDIPVRAALVDVAAVRHIASSQAAQIAEDFPLAVKC
jgi:hypothetical protein